MTRIALVVVLATHAAAAAPLCIPSGAELRAMASSGTAVVCWKYDGKETCAAVTPAGFGRSVAPPPVAKEPSFGAEVRDRGGKLSACRGTTCKPLGKRASAAARKAPAEATTDLRAVVVDGAAYDLATDAPIKLVPPKEYADAKVLGQGYATVMGELLLVSWTSCAGPCEKMVVADSAGVNRGAWFPSGHPIKLDDRRVAVLPLETDATMTVLEVATGKQLASLDLFREGAAVQHSAGAKLDDHTLFVATESAVAWIDLAGPKRLHELDVYCK